MSKKNWKQALIVMGIWLLVAGWWWYFLAPTERAPSSVPAVSSTSQLEDKEPTLRTTQPEQVDEGHSLTLIGSVVSNEFATIYARRSGIIKDLYVDIGDQIDENQTIGELLPPGDIGQSSANIYEKQVRVQEAQQQLDYLQQVADQKISAATLDSNLQSLAGGTSSAEMISKIETDIANKQRELEQLHKTQAQQLLSIEDDIDQAQQQAAIQVTATVEMLEHIMLWDEHNVTQVSSDDLRKGLWVKNTRTRTAALDSYRTLRRDIDQTPPDEQYQLVTTAESGIEAFLAMINASAASSQLSQEMLEAFTDRLLVKQQLVLSTDQRLEDLSNLYLTTQETQQQQRISLENTISTLEATLAQTRAGLQDSKQKSDQQLDLTIAEQQLRVQQAKNALEIAKANLSKEVVTSGNEKIVSPFAGTISKRMVQVGDVVSMGMPLYEMVDVPTSLAKSTPKEIKFGLPEEYLGLLQIGDQIEFAGAQNDTTRRTGLVDRISPQVDQMTKTVTVQVAIAKELPLPHNSRVNVLLPMIRQQTYQVPTATLIYQNEGSYLPVLIDEKTEQVELIEVTVLADDGEFADIQWDIDTETDIVTNYTTYPDLP